MIRHFKDHQTRKYLYNKPKIHRIIIQSCATLAQMRVTCRGYYTRAQIREIDWGVSPRRVRNIYLDPYKPQPRLSKTAGKIEAPAPEEVSLESITFVASMDNQDGHTGTTLTVSSKMTEKKTRFSFRRRSMRDNSETGDGPKPQSVSTYIR